MQAKVKRQLGKEGKGEQIEERTKVSSHLCLLANEQAKSKIYAKQWKIVAYFVACKKVLNDFVTLNEYSKGNNDGATEQEKLNKHCMRKSAPMHAACA